MLRERPKTLSRRGDPLIVRLILRFKIPIIFISACFISFVIGFIVRNFIPVAYVNGKPIYRQEFAQNLVNQHGITVLENMITQKAVQDEIKKKNVQISDKELDERMAKITQDVNSQNVRFQDALAMEGRTLDSFKLELETQMKIEKLLKNKIEITDKEIDQYLKDNNIQKGEGAILISQEISIREILFQQKLRTEFGKWLEKLKKDANVVTVIQI